MIWNWLEKCQKYFPGHLKQPASSLESAWQTQSPCGQGRVSVFLSHGVQTNSRVIKPPPPRSGLGFSQPGPWWMLGIFKLSHLRQLSQTVVYTLKPWAPKRNLYTWFHSRIIHNSQEEEAPQVLIHKRTDKQNEVRVRGAVPWPLKTPKSTDAQAPYTNGVVHTSSRIL